MRKTFFLNVPYLEMGIAAASLAVAVAAFVYEVTTGAPSAAAQTQEAERGINVGGDNTGSIVINNYPESSLSKSMPSVQKESSDYFDGNLLIKPLECVRNQTSMKCNMVITSSKGGSLIQVGPATLASTNGRPYKSEEIGIDGGSSGKAVFYRPDAGVPTLAYINFLGVPEPAQEGTLHVPTRFGGGEEVIRFDVINVK